MTAIKTSYGCCDCPAQVWWDTAADGWRHVDGSRFCDESRNTGAAPGSYNRCQAFQRHNGGNAGCDRPSDGHRDHSAGSVDDFSFSSTTFGMTKLLFPRLHWTS